MGGEACGLGEGTHYGCECVMRRLAEAEARASGLESALAVAGEENAALTESRDAALRSLASEQARRETAEREREQLRESARIAAEAHRKEGDRALAAETSLSAALRRAEEAEYLLREVEQACDMPLGMIAPTLDAHRKTGCADMDEIRDLRTRAEALEKALADLVYCADCWDNPQHNVCEKHLAPARAALASLGSPQDERNTKKED
jgi:chromosome segregation ATPase